MLAVWIAVTLSILIVFAILAGLVPAFRTASRSWRLLSVAGIPLSLGGINFIIRFWKPTPGPYRANELYPYGDHLHAWAVSFGFTWLAFGLMFVGLALLGSRNAKGILWATLLASWVICWLPHGIIGLAFAWAGGNAPSVEIYRKWASEPQGTILLVFNAITLLAHFALSILGFVMTGIELRRERVNRPTVN